MQEWDASEELESLKGFLLKLKNQINEFLEGKV